MWRTRRRTGHFEGVDGRDGVHPLPRAGARAERGQSMIEYGLIVALISIGAIAVLVIFKAPFQQVFSNTVAILLKYG